MLLPLMLPLMLLLLHTMTASPPLKREMCTVP
jgi:hypothetical protein